MNISRSILMLLTMLGCILIGSRALGETLAIEGATVFDGTNVLGSGQVVLIKGNLIERVGPSGAVAIPDGARRIAADGKYLIPGLVDIHFHFNVLSDPQISPWLPLHFLAHGVTTQREMGNWIEEENNAWLADIRGRGWPTPRLLFTGPVLDGPNSLLPTQSIVVLDEIDEFGAQRERIPGEFRERGFKPAGEIPGELADSEFRQCGFAQQAGELGQWLAP